ncbi:hypothetical protein JY651_28660 [Pyxidicoccus parkwayensis]|uniref:Lipoprotein n=1 Tax=Pyxidicoccus parkwayensis TaxID=2813578 RepID=A0ABX7NKC2_9BACT|nr:hypothetical protein [Pyxidicoccus parkwaysis]QSQ19305.1 hypothetical protein JY651_28660 [Pyxidicoccus parkwaysis]
MENLVRLLVFVRNATVVLAATMVILRACGLDEGSRLNAKNQELALPNKPLPWQDTPPCRLVSNMSVVTIRGGCWVKVELPNPLKCEPRIGFVHEGGCYVPIDEDSGAEK